MSAPRGIDWDKQPLGEVADAELARELGVSLQAVRDARERRGIKKVDVWIDWDKQPLGEVEDEVLATRLGVTVSSVGRARRRRDICHTGLRGTDWGSVDWGMWDSDIAEMTGKSVKTVGEARIRVGYQRPVQIRVCPCGEDFEVVKKKQKFCSIECQKAVSRFRLKYGADGLLDEVVASLSRLRREVAKRR